MARDPDSYSYLVDHVANVAGPAAAKFWGDHLSTIPVEGGEGGGVIVTSDDCPLAFSSSSSSGGGDDANANNNNRTYADADLVVILLMDDGPCLGDDPPIAFSSDCLSDQYDRPIAGTVLLCTPGNFDAITASSDEGATDAGSAQRRKIDEVLQHEFAHILGMSGSTAPYWRDATDGGRPRTPRPLVETDVVCLGGDTDSIYLPSSTTTYAEGTTSRGVRYYEVITPTVRNVMMNQFDCRDEDLVRGARLDTNDNNCVGSHWSTVS